MAYIEKRSIGWRAQVRRKGWKNVTKTFRTNAVAERWVREVEQDMDVGRWWKRMKVPHTPSLIF